MPRILLVDDDTELVARNVDALVAGGFAVAVAGTTAGALDAARRDRPDAVVLEAMLDGGMAGFDLARMFAREFPTLPLLMVTRADEHLTAAQRKGQDRDGGWMPVARYLAKPVMPEVLAYELGHLLHEPG
jgi:DNA-binding response OmpR family regulator